MDNDACQQLQQDRNNWSRELHTQMLRRLTESGAALVVFDVYFGDKGERPMDLDLAAAMRENKHVVIRSKLTDAEHAGVERLTDLILPHKLFLDAAAGYGIGQ